MSVTASAPGKLMLLGDHAVVYGYPCLVTAVDLRVSVKIEKNKTSTILIETPGSRKGNKIYSFNLVGLENIKNYEKHTAFVVAAIKKVFSAFRINEGLNISTDGPIHSFGLGSSSAVTVATVFALAHLFDLNFDKKQVFELAYSAVLDVQKVGSGYDVASAVYGGTLYYQSAKTIDLLLGINWPILIGYSGQKASTTYLVNHVRQLRSQHPLMIDMIFNIIGNIVDTAKQYLVIQRWKDFGELVNINQGLLASLGVSTINLEESIYAARNSGAWGAKLSGAGGGDCMYAIVDEAHKHAVSDAISRNGTKILALKVDAEGVKLV